jgi:hypothetical protein
MIIIRYFRKLLSLWTTLIFAIVDIVAFVISASSQNITIPSWFYLTIAGIGLVMSNIQLYYQQEKKIEEYEKEEAELILSINTVRLDAGELSMETLHSH